MTVLLLFQNKVFLNREFTPEIMGLVSMLFCHNYNTIRRGKTTPKGQHFCILRFSFDFCFLMFNFVMPIASNQSIAYNNPTMIRIL
jgi:hypothetical protein